MKTIFTMFWGMLGGVFLAFGVIAAITLIGAGANQLGFTEWTARYYILCLGICVGTLCYSKHARKHWPAMIFFVIAVILVMVIGFQTFMDFTVGNNPVDNMIANLQSGGVMVAKAVMYVAPGAVMAFLIFISIDGARGSEALESAPAPAVGND